RLTTLTSVFPFLISSSIAAFVACGGSSSTGTADAGDDAGDAGGGDGSLACAASGSGKVTVTISGLPAGAAGSVKLDGAGGAQTATASGDVTLSGGTYTVTAARVVVNDPVVRAVYLPSVSQASVCVADGATATVTVTYSLVATS